MGTLLLFFSLSGSPAWSQVILGYIPGYSTPQPLSRQQINALQTETLGGIPTWTAIAAKLNTTQPEIHFIDTHHFASLPTNYGIHQAYAQHMGLASGASDFIRKKKGQRGVPRSLMALTVYVPENAVRDSQRNEANWVLQNRRYRFEDSSDSFTDSLIQCQDLLRQSFSPASGRPHFITYNQSGSHRRPNRLTSRGRRDIAALSARGFGTLTESELAAEAGRPLPFIRVHNSIENDQAHGYLRIVESETDIERLTPQHIAIFPRLPERVPPVAAILTLEAQTELSHINVLAINRGTLNVAVAQEDSTSIENILEAARANADTPYRVWVSDDEIHLSPSSDEAVSTYFERQKQRVGRVDIPEIDTSTGLTVIKPSDEHGPSQIGAKAANYGRLERLLGSDLVKPGFAIGFELYRSIVREGEVGQSIEERLIQPLVAAVQEASISPREVNRELQKIRTEINRARLPRETVDSLIELVTEGDLREEKKIRFRSSTNCEDLPRFNGAGLYLSEGIGTKHIRAARINAESFQKLRKDLLLVVGSLWLPRAFWEREYFSIDHLKAGMAIQINPSFSNETANGVIIASKDGDATRFWVNSQLGEASVTNPRDGEIPESLRWSPIARTSEALMNELSISYPKALSYSNIGPVFVSEEGMLFSHRHGLFTQLLETTHRVLDRLIQDAGFGIDIEFKIMTENGEEKLYLKQARPLNLSVSH